MSQILGIDYGRKRCGVAVAQEGSTFAVPVETVLTEQLIEWIKGFADQEGLSYIVLGLPLSRDGAETEMSKEVRKVQAGLVEGGFLVKLHNEFKSSQSADLLLRHASKKKKSKKGIRDEMSASLILQEYLEFQELSRS